MSVKTVLQTLKAHAGLSAIVGTRIYRFTIPQKPTYPLILFNADEQFINTLSGKSSLNKWLYTFELKAKNLSTLNNMAAQLELALNSGSFSPVIDSVNDEEYEDDIENYTSLIEVSIWV